MFFSSSGFSLKPNWKARVVNPADEYIQRLAEWLAEIPLVNFTESDDAGEFAEASLIKSGALFRIEELQQEKLNLIKACQWLARQVPGLKTPLDDEAFDALIDDNRDFLRAALTQAQQSDE